MRVAGGSVNDQPFMARVGSGLASRRIASSRSAQVRAMGPATARLCPKDGSMRPRLGLGSFSTEGSLPPGEWPCSGTMPWLGLWPQTPQKWAGLRIEPPMSEPSSRALRPAAMAAALPPDEPPGMRLRSWGLFVVPYLSLKD